METLIIRLMHDAVFVDVAMGGMTPQTEASFLDVSIVCHDPPNGSLNRDLPCQPLFRFMHLYLYDSNICIGRREPLRFRLPFGCHITHDYVQKYGLRSLNVS